MRNQSMSTDEFNNRFEEAVRSVDGPHPERAVQLLEDLMLEASEFYLADDQIVIQLRMYLGSALWRSDVCARAVPILEAALEDAIRALGWEDRVTFSCAGNLCRALSGIGRDKEAVRLATSTYEKRITVFGELDNGTLNSLGHLASLYFDSGNFKQADTNQQQKAGAEPGIDSLAVQGHADELQLRAQCLVELGVINHLDQRPAAGEHGQSGAGKRQIGSPEPAQFPECRHAQIHHDQTGQPARRIHHHEEENQAQIKQPGLGQLGKKHQGNNHQDRAEDRSEKERGPAEKGEQKIGARARRADDFGRDHLEIQCRQSAGNTREQARKHEGHIAHRMRVVADEFNPLRVVAHGVEHAPERRASQREHQCGADEAVDGDQVIDLDLRAESDAHDGFSDHPIARDAALSTRKLGQHQRHRPDQLANTQGDHRERRSGFLGRDIAEQNSEAEPGQTTGQRHQADRNIPAAAAGQIQAMDRQETAQTAVS